MDKFIIEGGVENKKPLHISSDNLIGYLVGKTETNDGVFRGDLDDFDKQIELPEEIHRVIKEMYESKKESAILGGKSYNEQRMRLADELDNVTSGLGSTYLETIQADVIVEQARVVYLDSKTLELKATSPVCGSGVEVDIWDSIVEGTEKGLLVMGIHTHPDSGMLLSITDYSQIIIGEPANKMRLLNAQMILCQDIQVLAIATKDTPLFSDPNDVGKLVNERNNDINNNEVNLTRSFLPRIKEIYETHDNPEEQYRKEARQVEDENSHYINSAFVAFAKEMQVKLYFGQDMRTFKEFSA
jgi:predicted nucleic acid-binding protein